MYFGLMLSVVAALMPMSQLAKTAEQKTTPAEADCRHGGLAVAPIRVAKFYSLMGRAMPDYGMKISPLFCLLTFVITLSAGAAETADRDWLNMPERATSVRELASAFDAAGAGSIHSEKLLQDAAAATSWCSGKACMPARPMTSSMRITTTVPPG